MLICKAFHKKQTLYTTCCSWWIATYRLMKEFNVLKYQMVL